eukprot:TRINITY_DN1189_c0_g1_i3.p1 TRINITY_DN1189_c0_g1~~TRINITY_DN1189_c0_g1_i3.p1  ORF type:complete len:2400 (-),score=855.86 TRINITY_DN1189_c0_g1_i3:116-6346(-)
MMVTLTAMNGVMTLGNQAGLTFAIGNGFQNSMMKIQGTVTSINTCLQATSLVYTPNTNFVGADTIKIDVSDMGASGTGGEKTANATIAITVTAVNDAPSIGAVSPVTVAEDSMNNTVPASVISDIDVAAGNMEVTLTVMQGTVNIGNSNGVTFANGGPSNTMGARFTGTITACNTALASLTYTPTANWNGATSIKIGVSDMGNTGTGGEKTANATISVTVSPVNDGPSISVGSPITVAEDSSNQAVASIVIADVDAGANPIKVTMSASWGVLSLGTTTGLTFVTGNGNQDTMMVFTATVTAANTAVATATYNPSANYVGADTIRIGVSDQGNNGSGGEKTANATIGVTVTAVNDGPTLTLPSAQNVNEDTDLTVGGIMIGDIDVGMGMLQVNVSVMQGRFSFVNNVPATFTQGGMSQNQMVSFTANITNANKLLMAIVYRGNMNFNGNDNMDVRVSDMGNTGTGGAKMAMGQVAITVGAVNDGPTINTISNLMGSEDTQLAINGISIADVDIMDKMVQVNVSVMHGTFSFANPAMATFASGGNSNNMMASFTANITNANKMLMNILYQGNANWYGMDKLNVSVSDMGWTGMGGPKMAEITVMLDIKPVNDAPVLTMATMYSTNEDTDLTFSGISVADVDMPANAFSVNMTCTNGALYLQTTAGISFVMGTASGSNDVKMMGTLSAINGALGNMVFRPTAQFNGNAMVNVWVDDKSPMMPGKDSRMATVAVGPVNDQINLMVPHTLFNTTRNLAKGIKIMNPVQVADVDAMNGMILVNISSTGGSFTLNNTNGLTFVKGDGNADMMVSFKGTVAAVNAINSLVFLPGINKQGMQTIMVWVSDESNSGSGGKTTAMDNIRVNVVSCPADCAGNGICQLNGQCACNAGWTNAANCSIPQCPGNCNNGLCQTDGTCKCDAGWVGGACDTKLCGLGFGDLICSGQGACNNGTCACTGGFSGPTCASAPAPTMQNARLSDSGALIAIQFSGATNRPGSSSGSFACSAVLHSNTVGLLTGATCAWSSDSILTVQLSSASTIAIGNNVAILPNKIGALQNNGSAPFAGAATTALLTPTNPVTPSADLAMPSEFASCDDLTISAAGSTGSGGRNLMTYWSVGPMSDGANVLQGKINMLTGTTISFTMPSAQLNVANGNYSVCLIVGNWLGRNSSKVCKTAKRSSDPLPTVTVSGASTRTHKRPQALTLAVQGLVSTCAGPAAQGLTYAWTMVSGGAMPGGVITNRAVLNLPENSLMVGTTYVFRATVSVTGSSPVLATSTTISVQVVPSAITAVIANGNRAISVGSALVLDASKSVDPDNSGDAWTYTWTCVVAGTNNPCRDNQDSPLSFANAVSVSVPANTMQAGGYKFNLAVTKGTGNGRSDSTSVTITYSAAPIPQVSIQSLATAQVLSQDKLVLNGSAVSSTGAALSYLWTVDGNALDLNDRVNVLATSKTSPLLVIREDALSPQTYKFRLTATDSNGASYAEIEVKVNQPPTSGRITVSPPSGLVLNTTFTVSALDWADTPGDDPFTYTFGYLVNGEEQALVVRDQSSQLKATLPQGELQLYVRVYDALGSRSDASYVNVTVNPLPVVSKSESATRVENAANDVDKAEQAGDVTKLQSLATTLTTVLTDSFSNNEQDTQVQAKVNNVRQKVLKAVDIVLSSSTITKSAVKAFSKTINTVSNDRNLSPQNQNKAIRMIKKLAKAASLDRKTTRQLIGSISNIFRALRGVGNGPSPVFSARRLLAIDQQARNTGIEIANGVRDVSRATSNGLVCGEDPVVSSNADLTIRITQNQVSSLADNTANTLAGASFTIPAGSFGPNGCKTMVEYNFVGDLRSYGQDNGLRSNLHGLFVQDTTVTGLNSPITINIPLLSAFNATQTGQCVFWDNSTETYSTTGCTTGTVTSSAVTCTCTHLTEFAVRTVNIPATPTPTPTPTATPTASPGAGGSTTASPTPAPAVGTIIPGLADDTSYAIIGGGLGGLAVIAIIVVALRNKDAQNGPRAGQGTDEENFVNPNARQGHGFHFFDPSADSGNEWFDLKNKKSDTNTATAQKSQLKRQGSTVGKNTVARKKKKANRSLLEE